MSVFNIAVLILNAGGLIISPFAAASAVRIVWKQDGLLALMTGMAFVVLAMELLIQILEQFA